VTCGRTGEDMRRAQIKWTRTLGPLPFSRLVKLPWPLVKVRIVGRVTAYDSLGVISLSLWIRICALSAPDSLFTHSLLICCHLLTSVLSAAWMILDRVIPFVRIALIAVISCGLHKFAACGVRYVTGRLWLLVADCSCRGAAQVFTRDSMWSQ
jgi:hypothetical protein